MPLDIDENLDPERRLSPQQELAILDYNEILGHLRSEFSSYSFTREVLTFFDVLETTPIKGPKHSYFVTHARERVTPTEMVDQLYVVYSAHQLPTRDDYFVTIHARDQIDFRRARAVLNQLKFTPSVRYSHFRDRSLAYHLSQVLPLR